MRLHLIALVIAAFVATTQSSCSSADVSNKATTVARAPANAPRIMKPVGQNSSGDSAPAQTALTSSAPVVYNGGIGGVGVETSPKVYLVFWGSQWSSDPSGEASILQSFFAGVGGSTWNSTVTQYCQGVASGTTACNGAGQAAGNPTGVLAGTWFDTTAAAPAAPAQTDLANEAVAAAAHFGNTAAASNVSTQYVIATAHGNNPAGFGTYCAFHAYVASAFGNVAYVNLPYITDGGAGCGANFNGLGPNAGITIVAGHEFAETETDQFPSGGWLDGLGSEIADKCEWVSSGQGAAQNATFSTGTFPVQSLWSNIPNGTGACVMSIGTTTICTPGDSVLCCDPRCTKGCACAGESFCNSTGTAWSNCDGATCLPQRCF